MSPELYCPVCEGKVQQLTNQQTGSTVEPDKLLPYHYCQKCCRTYATDECVTTTSILEHAKKRVYEDFAKKRAEIERIPDGKNKAKALILWHTLWGLCNNNP